MRMIPNWAGYCAIGVIVAIVGGLGWWSYADKSACEKRGGVYAARIGLCFDKKVLR